MRRDGDRLIAHLASAKGRVVLCAPFIKVGVLKGLFDAVPKAVDIEVVTRWLPDEVAVGVSDLEVFDLVAQRQRASLKLLDNLHAKIYLADDRALVGSANLTRAALGWAPVSNVELLVQVSSGDLEVAACLFQIEKARIATAAERDRVRADAEAVGLQGARLDRNEVGDVVPAIWLPKSAAPDRLFQAYNANTRGGLTNSVLEAALDDIAALGIPDGLSEQDFTSAVSFAFRRMPGIERLLEAAGDELADSEAVKIIGEMTASGSVNPSALDNDVQWRMISDWIRFFLKDYEIAPANFVVRKKSWF